MSNVTNLLLAFCCSEDEDERIREVNAFFDPERDVRGLVAVDDPKLPPHWYGGSKMLEVNLYLGAFNYFRETDFMEYLCTKVQWYSPEQVQVMIRREEDDVFTILTLTGVKGIHPAWAKKKE
ncbi:MAG: hypothetical protein WC505_06270 [Patescibacteria group bacterium]